MKEYDLSDFEGGYGNPFHKFQDLGRHKIHNILLVSSMYDSFILAEDGRLYESLLDEYRGLNLWDAPRITRVSSAQEAIKRLKNDQRYDLIITSLKLPDMHVHEFAHRLRGDGVAVPIVLLTYDTRALSDLARTHDLSVFDKVFAWQGDFRIFLAITKCMEDMLNVENDTGLIGVQCIILIEDNFRYYSSYLPMIYTELMRHSQSLIQEGVNPAHKLLRMRARPKILHCETYEEAWSYYEKYHDYILGVISDMQFPRSGKVDDRAGVAFSRSVRVSHADIPILLQSRDPASREWADRLGVSFLLKDSPTLLKEIRAFLKQELFFGDFVFRQPDGTEVGRASDLRSLEKMLRIVPDESLRFHGERNHFSNWLKARVEFLLAYKLRPRRVSDYASIEDLRQYLIRSVRELRVAQHQGNIIDFDSKTFDPDSSFARIGAGSLGGKGRGLAFVNSMISTYLLRDRFDGAVVSVPPTVVLATDLFDRFMLDNNLWETALMSRDDIEIERRFLNARLPDDAIEILRVYLDVVRYPLAVRSSSLLEDSEYQPFAGIYATHMLPNNNVDPMARLDDLLRAVKRVYASQFSQHAKCYIAATPYRLEEEKMAVVIQRLVGAQHGDHFYPDFAGVASSHNYYPIAPMQAADGLAAVSLGLGPTVLEGGRSLRFSPHYPQHPIQFSTVEEMLQNSQKEFCALAIPDPGEKERAERDLELVTLRLAVAEADGVLEPLASTYIADNNKVYDGMSRNGPRIISFAGILKHERFPLPEMLSLLLKFGSRGMSSPVEIEFAVNLNKDGQSRHEFSLLQLRPMVVSHEWEELAIEDADEVNTVCRSAKVLGDGVVDGVRDVVFVDVDRFDRSLSRDVAGEIAEFNASLSDEGAPYVLIGVGRWGSADPWLGIPVTWDQISGARVMVETDFRDMKVTPSQGTHFFQNIISFRVGYFTVDGNGTSSAFLNWDWLREQPPKTRKSFTTHLRFPVPLTIKMNGRSHEGIILKPRGRR